MLDQQVDHHSRAAAVTLSRVRYGQLKTPMTHSRELSLLWKGISEMPVLGEFASMRSRYKASPCNCAVQSVAVLMDIQLEHVHVEQQKEVVAQQHKHHHDMDTNDLAQYWYP